MLTELAIPVIYLTAFTDDVTRKRARQTAPYGYLVKPFDERTVQTTIEMALERHARDRQTRTHEQWLMATLASLGDAVVTTDADGRITFINPAAEQLLRCAQREAIGAAPRRCGHPPRSVHARPDRASSDDRLTRSCPGPPDGRNDPGGPRRHRKTRLLTASCRSRQPNGASRERCSCSRSAPSSSLRQCIARRSGRRQKINRFSACVCCRGGIAHNFNNLLTVVRGNAELARFDISEEHPAYASLAQIAPAVERAADLTSQLRAYAGNALYAAGTIDLNGWCARLPHPSLI